MPRVRARRPISPMRTRSGSDSGENRSRSHAVFMGYTRRRYMNPMRVPRHISSDSSPSSRMCRNSAVSLRRMQW